MRTSSFTRAKIVVLDLEGKPIEKVGQRKKQHKTYTPKNTQTEETTFCSMELKELHFYSHNQLNSDIKVIKTC